MTDEVAVKKEPREIHPEGQFSVICVDLIALGMRVQDYDGKETGACESCALVFVSTEKNTQGYQFSLAQELNVTLGKKSKLLKFLTDWRGRAFTTEELGAGFVLSAYVGKTALVSVIHKTSHLGNKRAEIATIMPLPAGLTVPTRGDYRRPDFWEKKKAEYAAHYKIFMAQTMKAEGDDTATPKDETPF